MYYITIDSGVGSSTLSMILLVNNRSMTTNITSNNLFKWLVKQYTSIYNSNE